MQLSPSAHVDTFCRDNLPPDGLWPELQFSLPGLRYPDRLNAAVELLDATADARGGGRPCLLSPDAAWSYDDVLRISNQVARVLAEELGVVPGNRVLLRGPNNPWLAACWLGVLKAGGVVVTTMSLLRAGELATICQVARVRLALCDHRFTGELAAAGVPACGSSATAAPGRTTSSQRAARMPRRLRGRGHRRRRRGDDRVHVGHHRPAQGGHALPPRPARDRRHLLRARAQAAARTTSSPAPRRWPSPTGSAGC